MKKVCKCAGIVVFIGAAAAGLWTIIKAACCYDVCHRAWIDR